MDELIICVVIFVIFLYIKDEGFTNPPDKTSAVTYARQIISDNLPWNSYEETKSIYNWLDPVMYERIRMMRNTWNVNFIANVLSKK